MQIFCANFILENKVNELLSILMIFIYLFLFFISDKTLMLFLWYFKLPVPLLEHSFTQL